VETADAKKVAVSLYIAFFVNDQKVVLATVRTKQQVWRQNYVLEFGIEILSPLFLVSILICILTTLLVVHYIRGRLRFHFFTTVIITGFTKALFSFIKLHCYEVTIFIV